MNALNGMETIILDISNLFPYMALEPLWLAAWRIKYVKVILYFILYMHGTLSVRDAEIEKEGAENIYCYKKRFIRRRMKKISWYLQELNS